MKAFPFENGQFNVQAVKKGDWVQPKLNQVPACQSQANHGVWMPGGLLGWWSITDSHVAGRESSSLWVAIVRPQPLAQFQGQLQPDPDHHFPAVDLQIFGGNTAPGRQANMQGFVKSYYNQQQNVGHSQEILYYFKQSDLPVLTTMATEFAVFNRWFASIPGPTICSRAFAHYGTSFGRVDMNLLYVNEPFKSIYDRMINATPKHTSKLYYYLYGYTKSGPAKPDTSGNGPDTCAHGDQGCPPVSHSVNRNGFVSARVLLSESINSSTSAVPFYFQQTLGGQDINSNLALGSYQDYRFRAPNLLLFQGSVEHSIWGPFGAKFMADEGQVALTRGEVGFNHMKHSFAAGLTLRAGAFPMVSVMFAWGGSEGTHDIFNMNSSLLNGSARPLLD
ncbi:MAG: alkaline phosphatase family protein [Candidatus Sulfotelmatobacter sp.]